jgi:hypothetical protein
MGRKITITAGKVNVFGKIKGDPEVFKEASSREGIRVERS